MIPELNGSSSNGEAITYETICAYNATNLNANPLIANVTFTGTHPMLDEPVVVRYRFELPPAAPVLGFDVPESTITLDGTQPGSINLDIDSNLKWEIINGSPEWLTFTPANGTGDGTVECSFTENTAGHNLEAMVSLVGRRPDGTDIVKRVEYTFILPVPQTEP